MAPDGATVHLVDVRNQFETLAQDEEEHNDDEDPGHSVLLKKYHYDHYDEEKHCHIIIIYRITFLISNRL